MTSAPRVQRSNAHAFRMEYAEPARIETLINASPSGFLGIVRHDRSSGGLRGSSSCPVVCLDLPQFNGPSLVELWTSSLPVTYDQTEGIHCAINDEVLFGALQVEERPGMSLDFTTYTAYRRLLVQVNALGFPHLLRVWNYFPRINGESDGLERYQRFCAGRHQALVECLSDFPRSLPAGTAIGTMSGPLSIHFLAAREPGTHVENPRQVRAYEYPRVYGVRSPSFARATLRPSVSGFHLLIAGTASVVGHVSKHIGEPHKQTMEIVHNLNALITHTEQLHGVTRGQWDGQAFFKIYLRHPDDFTTVRDILNEQLPPHTEALYLHGEMCRSELLLEIEGVLSQEKTIDVNQTVSPSPRSSSTTGRIPASRMASSGRHCGRDGIARIVDPDFLGAMPAGAAQGSTRQTVDVNRRFYDALWSASYVVPPQRFNTWPLLCALAASAPERLEIGPGLRPRLPIAGTSFVDSSQPAVSSLKGLGGHAILGEITALPFPDRSFDLVCAFDIVEHIEDDRQALRELSRVAKDDAPVIFSVPLHPARWSAFDALVGHIRRYDPEDLPAILGEHFLALEQSAGFGMQPRSGWLLDFAVWGLTHRRVQAMRWYNRLFLPLGLFLQKPLTWAPGLIDAANVDEILLVCRRRGRHNGTGPAEDVRKESTETPDRAEQYRG